MIELYAKEFVAIGRYLERQGKVRKGYALIEKGSLEVLLDRNHYDTSNNKLKIWKALKWIDTEADGRLTKRVYEGANHRYRPYVKLNMAVLEQLEKLQKQKK